MHTTNMRKVGGSVMLVIPTVLLNLLHLQADAAVAVGVEDGRLIVDPKPRPRYTLEELLAKCDPTADATEMSEEDRIWINLPPVGREL